MALGKPGGYMPNVGELACLDRDMDNSLAHFVASAMEGTGFDRERLARLVEITPNQTENKFVVHD